ncbi:E3 ubiquitin-protein ligase SH3RF3-like [Pteronotus mesoamericanus]|uniref:E3 ubiquitin-protein ligase SH3RF3-like n=1 Tax=Pteronotus mesoamericanus TaxID=1884717 RepID=UPI0023ED18FA|nr:E3 ubiquitin-protein ligase SH3RF3-like [Pteronotus parnellii mesoamericanus]
MLLGASWLCASKAAASPAQSEDGDDRPGSRRRRATAEAAGEDMDESSLLDLLECSVCLERLDTTAKVLPCQHTFCRRCLESIVRSRHELRCPECRVLVGCGVEELPANILLVRLLDGIRQRPRAAPGSGEASEFAEVGGSTAGSAPGSPAFSMEAGSLRELATSRNVPLAKPKSLA